jgi:carbonic anhydrase
MITAQDALLRLRDGNLRFARSHSDHAATDERRRRELAGGQEPFAVIVGCSDSRVPAEIVFDQGLGDLFVIRVAGNIMQPSQIGSVEFACSEFGTRLVVVLGHSDCGAIRTTLKVLTSPEESQSQNIAAIVELIRPTIEHVLQDGDTDDTDGVVERAVRENILASAERLRTGSDLIRHLEAVEGLMIMAAEYSLKTGLVEFFEHETA